MTTVWSKIRTRAGVTVVAGVVGVAGMGTAAAAIVVNQEAVEEPAPVVQPTTSAPTVAAQTPAEATSVVEPPVVETPAATVEGVTTPEPVAPAPAAASEVESPAPYDATAPWVDRAGTTYVPAPDVPVEKLPSELGYDNSPE